MTFKSNAVQYNQVLVDFENSNIHTFGVTRLTTFFSTILSELRNMLQIVVFSIVLLFSLSNAAECTPAQLTTADARIPVILVRRGECAATFQVFAKKDCNTAVCRQTYQLSSELPKCQVNGVELIPARNADLHKFYTGYIRVCNSATPPPRNVTSAPTPAPVNGTNAPMPITNAPTPTAITNAPTPTAITNPPATNAPLTPRPGMGAGSSLISIASEDRIVTVAPTSAPNSANRITSSMLFLSFLALVWC